MEGGEKEGREGVREGRSVGEEERERVAEVKEEEEGTEEASEGRGRSVVLLKIITFSVGVKEIRQRCTTLRMGSSNTSTHGKHVCIGSFSTCASENR